MRVCCYDSVSFQRETNMHKTTHTVRAAAAISLFALAGAASAQDIVSQWNQTLLTSVQTTSMGPPLAARAMAMTQLAVFEAVNSVDRNYAPYRGYYATPSGSDKSAAAAQAAHDVLSHLFPTRQAIFATQLASTLSAIPNSASKAAGIELGRLSAAGMIQHRAADGSQLSSPVTPGTNPGQWRPTPGAFLPGAFAQMATTTPFGMTSPSQFRPIAPPSLDSAQYAEALNEVKTIGAANSMTRTQEQTDIARMWAFGGGSITPPGSWNRIAQSVATETNMTIDQSAHMFALLGMSQVDAAISSWDCKNEYGLWRPVTAIQLADQDGNASTEADPNWMPLLTTPNFQAYTSGHSTFSSAAAAVLGALVGDAYSFSVTGAGITRSFTSFEAAAAEAGMSRIYGGIHFSFDNEMGLDCGDQIGQYTVNNYLRVPAPASLATLAAPFLFARRRRR
jgi:hypothetical protein